MGKSNQFTEEWILKQQQKGLKVHDPIIDKKLKSAFGLPSKKNYSNVEKSHIEWVLIALQIPFAKEYKFLPNRKFRMDYAIIEKKIFIEYEGLMSDKSHHTTITGYTTNCQKYNLAIIEGWKMLRYTTLNYKEVGPDLQKLLHIEPTLSKLI